MSHIPHSQFLLERLRKQRERGFLCDCTVTIGEAKYEAHYNVLAAFSDFFSTQSIDVGKGETTIILDPELVTCVLMDILQKTTLEAENAEEPVVLKRGRGRPRTRPLPPGTVSPVKNEEASTFTPNKEKEKEGPVRKRGRPRVKPLPSETSVNPEGGVEEEISKEVEGDDERGQAKTSSSEAPDNENSKDDDYDDDGPNETSSDVSPTSKIRTSNRKRSLSRKLRENQANSEVIEEEGEDVAREEWDGEQEDNTGQNKHRPICNICGNLFSEMSSLRRHMRIHKGIKPYQCQLCGRCFRQGNQLKTHTRIHTGEKPFHCTSCSACFAQKCQLVYHCRMHHGEEKPHKCDVCPASFATSSNLKIHMRTHSGEKPYECNDCGKRFTQASTLMYHKRRHTGEKPYVCDTCGMSFAVSSSLIAHSRKHTGSRRVTCNICGNTLSDIYSLKKHRALKHNGMYGVPQKILLYLIVMAQYHIIFYNIELVVLFIHAH
uniref:Wilms tumor protein homolog n=1 Tax=Astyanax mexicanus TaxID=7994 RepID=A0A3B1JDD9_ASTMX